ncbi:FecR family protein [Denitromonas iodatirespirans]|uniref:FecR domain-containing protein n=1 Tax=Denitromonas iodatirespirans TaxID=2795389 RepID=A0A944D582_DENI1|nr:FecR domain-containing protein [Denitromonas iodatirespirans]MBT0960080.1 FecR domain-containing protein [Denitromonas iodatirespirans]
MPRNLTVGRLLAWALVACALFVASAGRAAEETVNYVVQPGDTLIGLGETLLEDPDRWPVLQRLNAVADPYRIPIGRQLRIPVRLLRKVPREARVVHVSGGASADGQPLRADQTVSEGARLLTPANGFMTLELPDGSRLTLQPQTDVRIDALHGLKGADDIQRATFEVQQGRIETDVEPQAGPAARYRIHTPTAIIGVRGTSFRVAADSAETRTEMRQGTVGVSGAGVRREVALREGFGLVARADQPASAPVPLLAAPDLSAVATLYERPVMRVQLAPVAGAIGYRGQVARDAGFTQIVAESRATVPDLKIAGLADGDYFLRVRGVDSHGLEGRDADLAVRLKARPEPPFINAPRPDGKAKAGTVEFAWAQAEGAASYRFALARDAAFADLVTHQDALAANRLDLPLEAGEYHWRLASTRADGDRGPWGDAVRLTVRPPMAAVPPPTFDENHMLIAWGGEPGQRFDYQLADDDRFTRMVAEGSVTEPELVLPKPRAGAYYLRVRAIDPDGFVGSYSAPQRIVVPAEFPGWMLLAPLLILL